MGLYYQTLIREVTKEFENQNLDLESFLKLNLTRIETNYKISRLLLMLNLNKILEDRGVVSEYFKKELQTELLENGN